MRNTSLDLLKLFASYMVVFVHVKFVGTAGVAVTSLARFAVPLFFMVSGYYSYKNDIYKIKKKVLHLLKIFLFGILIYIFTDILTDGFESFISEHFNLYSSLKRIISFIFFNVVSVADHLWFLPALVYCYVIYAFVIKKEISHKYIYNASALLIGIHILLGEGLSVVNIDVPTYFVRNFVFMGFPFFMFGACVRENEKQLLKFFSVGKIVLFTVAGALESVFSVFAFGHNELYIGTLLVVFSLFALVLKTKELQYNKFVLLICKTSLYIYVLHILVFKLLTQAVVFVNSEALTYVYNYLKPVTVCVVTTAVAFIIEFIKSHISYKKTCKSELK